MTPAAKFKLVMAIWILYDILVFSISRDVSRIAVWLYVGVAIVGVYLLLLKCPNCGKAVLNNPIEVFGVQWWIWTPWVPSRCTKCQYPLKKLTVEDD